MSLFSYTATDYSGQKITGRMEAKDRAVLINNLRKNQLVIIAIRELKESEVRALKKSGRVKLDDLTVCFRQLAALVKAGIPLVKSLNILFAQAESPFLKEILSVCLFGSVRSGQERPTSDIDLLVIIKNNARKQFIEDLFINMNRSVIEETGMNLDAHIYSASELKDMVADGVSFIKEAMPSGAIIIGKSLEDCL